VSSDDIDPEDVTEAARRLAQRIVNADQRTSEEIAADHDGVTWTTDELQRDFEVLGFAAPFVVVRRRSDGMKGSLTFRHNPRIYYGWEPER
jgi:hypothetical protein